MTRRARTAFVIALSLLGAGALAATVLVRSEPVESGAASRPGPEAPEFRAGEMTFDLSPERLEPAGLGSAVASVVRREAPDAGLPPSDAAELAQLVGERVELLVAPDYERWLEVARRTASGTGRDAAPDFRRAWEFGASALRGTPIASEGIGVRPIEDPGAFPKDRMEPGTLIVSSNPKHGGADYALPEGPGLRGMEVLVPVRFRPAHGAPVPGTIGMHFARTATSDWQPAEMFVYFGPEAFGKDLPFPPF